ncbi:hypothetical protein [Actinacidiphila sp. bgisy160]|uniref:hypothetical protein n=1 Tax=Actinacidiphila sp. bgisy160 TaxID=3413796 RepID=UPI003D73AF5B
MMQKKLERLEILRYQYIELSTRYPWLQHYHERLAELEERIARLQPPASEVTDAPEVAQVVRATTIPGGPLPPMPSWKRMRNIEKLAAVYTYLGPTGERLRVHLRTGKGYV